MIEKIIIISLLVFSVWYSMQEGEIFGKLGDWLQIHLPEKIHNPVFDCSICMTPWYGSIIYWLYFAPMKIVSLHPIYILIPSSDIIEWPLIVIAAMGLNAILTKLFPPHKIKVEYEEKIISKI